MVSIVILSEAKNLGSSFDRAPGNGDRPEMFRFAQHDSAICNTKLPVFECSKNDFCFAEALAFQLRLNIRGGALSDIFS
jgi:hypothetical protein